MSNPQQELIDLKPNKEFFIGIDSDGCAFDSMEIKHKECFTPATIRNFKLQGVSKYAREVAEFVNLYSRERGLNRFPALISVLDILRNRKEVKQRNYPVPELNKIRKWMKEETKLGNPALKKIVDETGDAEFRNVLEWSEEVNRRVEEMVSNVPPFPFVNESLTKASAKADIVVVSQTPLEALAREWAEHGIDKYVRMIAGQEHGTKTEHLKFAAVGKYPADKILMLGDAMGDMKAANDAGTLFYPIVPGKEEMSWKRLNDEALDKFFNGTFKGSYAEGLKKELESALPEKPNF
ncbi:MAG: HAD hydrolase-like protein [Fibrobacteres bacterium]|nr:HAD hydrolase-like protein [Fibrobacterota bacterium]